MEDFMYFIASIIVLVITIIFLVKFFHLCSDVRYIKNVFERKWGVVPEEEPVQIPRGEGSISPTKSDVREFQERIKEYKKEHKVVDEAWLENLIKEYNAKYTEDFHQYL